MYNNKYGIFIHNKYGIFIDYLWKSLIHCTLISQKCVLDQIQVMTRKKSDTFFLKNEKKIQKNSKIQKAVAGGSARKIEKAWPKF